jgi:hypothetical protein
MSNEKQTAVDWLVEELLNGKALMPSIIEQAKVMEKRQIKNAFVNGYLDSYNAQNNINADEIFYEQTYGGKK